MERNLKFSSRNKREAQRFIKGPSRKSYRNYLNFEKSFILFKFMSKPYKKINKIKHPSNNYKGYHRKYIKI